MFQSYALWPHMTVFQNIVFGLVMQKKSVKEKEDRYKNETEVNENISQINRINKEFENERANLLK